MSELDPESFELHDRELAREASLQQAVDAVAAQGLGSDVAALMTALSRAIAARGLVQPPVDWLNAAAVEIARGNSYVVGTQSVRDAQTSRRDEP